MKPLRLLILFLCGYLIAFGVGGLLLPEVKNGHRNITLDRTETMQYRLANGKYFLPVRQDHRTPYRPYTPPRWIQRDIAYDVAHPRIRRIEGGRVFSRNWRQVGTIKVESAKIPLPTVELLQVADPAGASVVRSLVIKNEVVYSLEGRRTGCL